MLCVTCLPLYPNFMNLGFICSWVSYVYSAGTFDHLFFQRGLGSDLTIVSASAASLPSVLAYPKIKHVLLFGPILSKTFYRRDSLS